MKGNFIKFKRKLIFARIFKALMAGVAVGAVVSGIFIALSRLAVIEYEPIMSLPVGLGAFACVFVVVFLLLRTNDKRLARQLDTRLSLKERVQTALAFEGMEGGMIALQREDAQKTLGEIRTRKFKVKRIWIYCLALLLGVAILIGGFYAPDKRGYVPPEVIIPFEISEVQIAGIEELIKYVENSEMEEVYREEIVESLTVLLDDLKIATTEPEMQAAVATALTEITEITYDSSSMTEILNAMWGTGDEQVRVLARSLNTSAWIEPDWGDFAEKYSTLKMSFATVREEEVSEEEQIATLKWRLENFSLKVSGALMTSQISEDDQLHMTVTKLLNGSDEQDGIVQVVADIDGKTLDEASDSVNAVIEGMTDEFFTVISIQKTNTNVGEYVLKKLSALFAVPIPAFERPSLTNDDEGSDGNKDNDDENNANGGGIGEGVVFGSSDLVLDPITGKYVEYGTLYATYNTLMIEKLGDDKYGYTEEQKKAIEKYFALLYGGFKDEEGK